MPLLSASAAHGTRSYRSFVGHRARRAFAALVVVTILVLAFPSRAHGAYVYLDPGHGGQDPGATYGGVRESRVNLLVALDVRVALAARGHRVGLTRGGDTTLGTRTSEAWHWDDDGVHLRGCDASCSHDAPIMGLQARVDQANAAGADLFISIHNNAGSTAARGTEIYSNGDNVVDVEMSQKLAQFVQQGIVREAGTRDRGTHTVGFYVVRWANMPAILVEVGFVSNSADRALLLSSSFRRRVATGIADGVDRFLATDPFTPLYPRIAGPTRYATAAQVAESGWPDGAESVYVASGVTWPDSLAATPLAVETSAPVLLTAPGELPQETADALGRLAPEHVYLLGGERAVEAAVASQVASAAELPMSAVRRLAGADRYATAQAIAQEVGVGPEGTVFLVSGADFPDALSASARAGMTASPILMTRPTSMAGPTADFLAANAESIERVYVLGGPAAVARGVADQAATLADAQVTRVAGPTRYETNLAALRTFWDTGTVEPFVAKATDFPDALVSGVLAAQQGQPIMLVGTKYLPGHTREFLMNEVDRIGGFTMVGGEQAIGVVLEWEFVKAMRLDQVPES